MRETLRDPLRLDHIHDAIKQLLKADNDRNLDILKETDLEYFGLVKLLEIIGEAAYKLTNEFKDAHSDTPWKHIIGMRHILVHGYYQVNSQDVIKTIRCDLPILLKQIEKYIREMDDFGD